MIEKPGEIPGLTRKAYYVILVKMRGKRGKRRERT